MLKKMKFLLACAILAGAGAVLTGIGIAAGGIVHGIQVDLHGIHVYAPLLAKDGQGGGADSYVQQEEKLEGFDSIEVDLAYADIRVEQSDSDAYMLSYCLLESQGIQKEVKDGKLVIKNGYGKAVGEKQINIINWNIIGYGSMDMGKDAFVLIRLPKDAKLSEAWLNTDSGNIACKNIQTGRLHIRSEYGDVSLRDVNMQETEIAVESGKLQLEQVQGDICTVASEYGNASFYDLALAGDLKIKMESGDIRFRDTNASNLELESAYGDIDGTQTEFGNLNMTVECGDCNFQNILFEDCAIDSEYGDVELGLVKDAADYGCQLVTEYGGIKINGEGMGERYSSLDKTMEHLMQIQCESGDILIRSGGGASEGKHK